MFATGSTQPSPILVNVQTHRLKTPPKSTGNACSLRGGVVNPALRV